MVDREYIIGKIIEKRNFISYIANQFNYCPFNGECWQTCEKIFDGYKKTTFELKVNSCPCDYYSEEYVRKRMKELFPELYEGEWNLLNL